MSKFEGKSKSKALAIDKEKFEFNLETAFVPFLGLTGEDGDLDPAYYEALMNFYQAMEWDYVVETYPDGCYSGKEFYDNRISLDKIMNVRLV